VESNLNSKSGSNHNYVATEHNSPASDRKQISGYAETLLRQTEKDNCVSPDINYSSSRRNTEFEAGHITLKISLNVCGNLQGTSTVIPLRVIKTSKSESVNPNL
jgi:hypothetical protein